MGISDWRSDVCSSDLSVTVLADNRRITRETVQYMVDVARERGGAYKAAILIGDLGDQNAVNRRDGFFDIVDQHKDLIEVVDNGCESGRERVGKYGWSPGAARSLQHKQG